MPQNLSNQVVFSHLKSWITKQVNSVVEKQLTDKTYNVNDAQTWTNYICDSVFFLYQILKSLTAVNKNFKLVVNCIIMQKADCGLNISGSCYWDNEVDGTVTVKYDNNSLVAVVNVFGCGL